MRRSVPLLAAALAMLACSLSGRLPEATAPAPMATAPPTRPAAASTAARPTAPTATPKASAPEITADNITHLSPFMTFAEGELVRSLAFSPDGTALAAAIGDEAGTIQLYETSSGMPMQTLTEHESIVWDVAFSPDGRFLASAGRDHTARVWDWRNGSLLRVINLPNEVVSVEFSPNGQTLALGGVDEWPDAAIWTYAIDSWQPLLRLGEYWNIPAIAFSPDGSEIVGGGTSRNARVWAVSDGNQLHVLYHPGQVSSIAISPDGSLVATGLCEASRDSQCTVGAVWLWNLATGRLTAKLSGFPEVVTAVAFSVDGSVVMGASRDGSLRAYSASQDYPLLLSTPADGPAPASILTLAVSPDGRLLATAGVGRIDLWKIEP